MTRAKNKEKLNVESKEKFKILGDIDLLLKLGYDKNKT